MESDHQESVWRRGWRDTKSWWTDWKFLVLEVLGMAVAGAVLNKWAIVLFAVVGVCAIWVIATIRAPFIQRDEARNALVETEEKQGHGFVGGKSADGHHSLPLEINVDFRDLGLLKSSGGLASSYRLSSTIAFQMNRPVQIADVGLLIDTDDTSDRIKPLISDFQTPHTLTLPGEYKFVFDITPYATGSDHQCLLRVVVAGKPYTDMSTWEF